MEEDSRYIIIYETNGTWEMPLELFEKHEAYAITKDRDGRNGDCYRSAFHEEWFATLTKEEQAKIIKR